MSSRRGGAGGRKGKNSKANKQGGKGGDASSELPPDGYHNLHLPCSRFLQDTCKEVWTIDEDESSLLLASSSPLSSSLSAHERPDKRLGRMLRHHLLEKRRQEAAAAADNNPSRGTSATTSTSTTPPNKKKKKKKKKKANKQEGGAETAEGATANETESADAPAAGGSCTATEAEATVPISVSQNHHNQEDSSISGDMIMAVSAKEESLRTSASSAATTATMATSTSTTSSIANDTATASANSSSDNHHNHNTNTPATATNSAAWTTPVDAYLDRLLVQQDEVQKRLENEQSIIANSNSDAPNNTQNNQQNNKTVIARDLESFVQFLNRKHGSNENKGPLVITQQEVEAVCKRIKCEPCQQKMLDLLSQGNIQRQPVVLGGISFGDDNDNNNKAFPRNHANGLAIPVDHPALGIREDPTPSVDFDYVALEEGGNPIGAWMEAKADLQGLPYFHPQVSSGVAPSSVDPSGSNNHSSNNNHHHKNAHSKGSNANTNTSLASSSSKSKQQQHAAQMEWRFVSSSATQNQTLIGDSNNSTTQTTKPDTATNQPDKNLSPSSSSSTIVTVQDLEHILKNVMLPLSMPLDELLGACADLTEDEVAEIHERIKKLDMNINKDIHSANAVIEEGRAELREADLASSEGNLQLKAGPIYLQRNSEFHSNLKAIICEIAWEQTLWLGDGNTRVIRTTESWWNTVGHLTDTMLCAISETMIAVEEYETALQEEVADNSGKIPDLFLSKSHRVVYSKMLARRMAILNDLMGAVYRANCHMEEVWPMLSSGANSAVSKSEEGLKVFFRRKWYAQQELCRTIASRQSQEEGTKKGSTNNAKTKRDALQRHKVASSSTTASTLITAAIGPEKWVQILDINGGDLLSALVDLSKCENLPRLSEMKEEQIVRCQKVLGRLGRVARETFAPLADAERAKNSPTSFALQDEKLKSQCQSLSAQIQKEEELQQQQQLLAAPGEEEPSVTEQKRAVARLTIDSIKLLLHLRKCVTDSHEPQNPQLTLPIRVVSWLGVGARFQHVDMRDCSYSALVNAMLLLQDQFNEYPSRRGEEPVIPCRGEGSVMPRLTSVLLALFYGKLSEQCSEWHAEMNEQELLTNMTESDAGLQTGTISGEQSSTSKRDGVAGRNGTTVNSDNQGKASKKTKKKQKKSASTTQPSTADGTPGSGQELLSGPQKTQERSSSPSSNKIQEGTPDGTATATNGHQEPSAATTKECLVAEEPAGKTTKTKGKKMKENKINSKFPLDDTDKTEAQSPEKGDKEEISTVGVDKDMGVKDHLGVFDSAENFLVKRLTALFKEAAQDSSSVVII